MLAISFTVRDSGGVCKRRTSFIASNAARTIWKSLREMLNISLSSSHTCVIHDTVI